MRIHLLVSFVLACTMSALSAQTPSTTPSLPQEPKSTSKLFTLNGCVQSDADTDQFTLWDPTDGRKEKPVYRLSGLDLKLFAGHRVRIVGGLVPSANVAAQAGALDPAKSSMVNAGGQGASTVGLAPLLEFRVKRVKPLAGSCDATR